MDSPDDRVIIEGNSDEPGQYDMNVTMLKDKYDKPRVIHRCHVKELLEIAPLKNDSGAGDSPTAGSNRKRRDLTMKHRSIQRRGDNHVLR